ncbi:uncharacterized protein HGUI_00885 [Hanseniaspora guilliermondii]|uniref:COBW domain-containing protein 1 n=1 Tax=Hanseniaspora guilliermondii TaxID=56406 RepID=A0A1L0CIT7_9ASCO|nr:uncharacterized protein HGUI_00885 [Hanseniaspora guilliermondii]
MSNGKAKLKDFSIKEGERIPKLVLSMDDVKDDLKDNVDIVSNEKINSCNTQLSTELLEVQLKKKIPITIITGFLGSGKSTMLNYLTNHLLQNKQELKIAVIMNEFGDTLDIEKSITIHDKQSNDNTVEWLDLGNGCICCSVKDAGVKAIEDLVKRQHGSIDYIILETSGMADPTNLAKMFWLDESLMSNIRLDGILTVLDSINMKNLVDGKSINEDSFKIISKQVAVADKIIVNKIDQISNDALKTVKAYIQNINNNCEVLSTTYGKINDLRDILFLNGYTSFDSKSKSLSKDQDNNIDSSISTIKIDLPIIHTKETYEEILHYLQKLHWQSFGYNYEDKVESVYGEILRTKGLLIVDIEKRDYKVIQGVRDTFEIMETSSEPFKNTEMGKLVLIGENLNKNLIMKELEEIFNQQVNELLHVHDDNCAH